MNDDRKRDSEPPDPERHGILERIVKKGIESGIGAISRSEDTVRGFIEGVKLPKEVAGALLDQVDETKKGLYTVVAKEIRDFLHTTNFASDVKKILTGLAFEVKMEVRFKNADDASGNIRPDVAAQAQVKSTRKPKKPVAPPEEPEADPAPPPPKGDGDE